jgi:hypothetical protein
MIRHLKLVILAMTLGLFAPVAPQFAFTGDTVAHGTTPDEMKKAWLGEVVEILGCYCGCDLTLNECEEDHLDCQIRPTLMQELPATVTPAGPSLLQLAGCSCGCGYRLAECQEKHEDCTQRPRIYQQLKRLTVKYGNESAFLHNSGLSMSDTERKMFSAAHEGYTSLLYVHKGESADELGYLKALQGFQEQYRDRLRLNSLSLADKKEKNLIGYYQIENPSVVMVASSGAVTALFKGEPPTEELKRGLVSPKMEEILLAIQQGMTTFVCVGHSNDPEFASTKRTVQSAIRKLGGIATAVWLDPGDNSEKFLLSALKYQNGTTASPVFVIAPTGLLVEKIEAGVTERRIFDSFQRILAMKSGCGQSTITGGSACQPGYGVTGESSCQ